MLYGIAINLCCLIGAMLLLFPIVWYLFSSSGWIEQRNKIIEYFSEEAFTEYFNLYFSTYSGNKDKVAFEERFGNYYGRRHFVFPLLLLSLTVGIEAWTIDETLRSWQNLPSQFALPTIVVSSLLGGYTWVVSDQISRLQSGDFGSSDVTMWVFRLVAAMPFGIALSSVAKDDTVIALAFFIGVFPTKTLFAIARRLGTQKLGLGDDANTNNVSELETLQNITTANAERFSDEGISTIAQLAWTDPVNLTIRTNFEFNYVLDCMSQALLAVYVGTELKNISKLSFRGAHEICGLMEVLDGPDGKHKEAAERAVLEAATLLKITPTALFHTLDFVKQDPYAQFIWAVWGQSSEPDADETPEEE